MVIFNPDQWRGDALAHLGHPAVRTPNIDRLVATEAVSFRHAFAQATVCTPSRCSFMTGWYPHVRGHRTMHHMLNPTLGETNLLKVLRDTATSSGGAARMTGPGATRVRGALRCPVPAGPEDYERWGVTPQPGSHGGTCSWRGPVDGDNYFSFYKGRLETTDGGAWFDGDWAMVRGAIDFLRRYTGITAVPVSSHRLPASALLRRGALVFPH